MEAEVARTFKRSVAGRRVVEVKSLGGRAPAAIGTGHQTSVAAPRKGVSAKLCDVKQLVQLSMPFTLQREATIAWSAARTTATGSPRRPPRASRHSSRTA
ncbi:encapsulin [Paraburkholderia sp. MM5477-R1]|uniref:encapsulin n=1 Tax=Paraburkholderia sp. MM5477-R1 TaxID=2991062 RepID=UPI003D1A044B